MKRAVILTICMCWRITSYGQKDKNAFYDSLVAKSIFMYFHVPDCPGCTGATLIQISYINDSIAIKSLYSSSPSYDFTMDRQSIRKIDTKYRGILPKWYSAIAPVYVYYDDGVKHAPSKHSQRKMKRKIEKTKSIEHILKPIVWITYPSVY